MTALFTGGKQWAFSLTCHMVKNPPCWMAKKHGILHWDIENKVKLDRLEFLCVRIYYVILPSSMVDFVPCDQLVQKAHLGVQLREKKEAAPPVTAITHIHYHTQTICHFMSIHCSEYEYGGNINRLFKP